MSSLTSVRMLVKSMLNEERKVARKFLTVFSGSKGPNLSLKLFDLLCRELKDGHQLTDREIENLLYPQKSGGTAYLRLIFRLRDKLRESLILSVNLERKGAYSDRGLALHEMRKATSEAQILHARGDWNGALSLLDNCIDQGTRFEHYEELAAALRLRIQMRSYDKGTEAFVRENTQYETAIRALLASKKALQYYTHLISETLFKASPVSSERLEKQILELREEYLQTGSANVAFYLNYIEAHYYQQKGQYKVATATLRDQIHLLETKPAVSQKTRLNGVLMNLAWNEIYTQRFASALRYTTRVLRRLPNKDQYRLQCYEINFYAYFYKRRYTKALEYVTILLKQDTGVNAEYRIGRRQYQKACALFMLGKHDQVQKILNDLNPIEDDSEGWNIGLRLLHIMNDIELEKTENAFNRIENMRKHLDKLKKAGRSNQRDILKYEILRSLINTRFDFMETRRRKSAELEKLSLKPSEYEWKILSPELIIFDQWFNSKVLKQDLTLKMPAYFEQAVA